VDYSYQLSDVARAALYAQYNSNTTAVQYDLERQRARIPSVHRFNDTAQLYAHAILDGRRITPTSQSLRKSAGSSIVKYIWDGQLHAGEVVNIFHHPQTGIADTILFAEV
jgi:hypothetical protein